MEWLSGGHRAFNFYASVVYVNGTKLCNEATMRALERKGLVKQINSNPNEWIVTEAGKTGK